MDHALVAKPLILLALFTVGISQGRGAPTNDKQLRVTANTSSVAYTADQTVVFQFRVYPESQKPVRLRNAHIVITDSKGRAMYDHPWKDLTDPIRATHSTWVAYPPLHLPIGEYQTVLSVNGVPSNKASFHIVPLEALKAVPSLMIEFIGARSQGGPLLKCNFFNHDTQPVQVIGPAIVFAVEVDGTIHRYRVSRFSGNPMAAPNGGYGFNIRFEELEPRVAPGKHMVRVTAAGVTSNRIEVRLSG
ncbi:MAG: hypothetical protein V1495_06140 [Pseudomonadota bacterium]